MLSILHHYMDTVGYFITVGFALFYIFKGIFYSDWGLRAAPSAAFRCIQWDRWPRSLFRPTLVPHGPPPQHPCLSFVSICCKTSFLPWNVLYNILTLKIPTLKYFSSKGNREPCDTSYILEWKRLSFIFYQLNHGLPPKVRQKYTQILKGEWFFPFVIFENLLEVNFNIKKSSDLKYWVEVGVAFAGWACAWLDSTTTPHS